jgi:hypothetical protein
MLYDLELIKPIEPLTGIRSTFMLSAKGWKRVQELQSNNTQLSQAFIAMWFDNSMKDAREAISKAISDCGFVPVVIDVIANLLFIFSINSKSAII